MIPGNLVGLLLFVLAVAPGWVWVRVAERRQVLPDRSTLLEAAQLVATGVVFTTAAAIAVLGIGTGVGWLPDLREITAVGSTFLYEEPYRSGLTLVAILGLSLVGAYGAARIVYRGQEPSLVPAGSVWRDVFGEGGAGRPIFVSTTLVDGRVVDGYLYSYSTDADGGDQDLALQEPIHVWSGEPAQRMRVPAHRAVLRAEQIVAMWVRYDWERSKSPSDKSRWRRTAPSPSVEPLGERMAPENGSHGPAAGPPLHPRRGETPG